MSAPTWKPSPPSRLTGNRPPSSSGQTLAIHTVRTSPRTDRLSVVAPGISPLPLSRDLRRDLHRPRLARGKPERPGDDQPVPLAGQLEPALRLGHGPDGAHEHFAGARQPDLQGAAAARPLGQPAA